MGLELTPVTLFELDLLKDHAYKHSHVLESRLQHMNLKKHGSAYKLVIKGFGEPKHSQNTSQD